MERRQTTVRTRRGAAIDSYRDVATERTAELDRLRREAAAARAELSRLERNYAGAVRELADIQASRAWRFLQFLRRLVRAPRRRRRASAATFAPGARQAPPGIALIALSPGPDAVTRCNAAAAASNAERIAIWDGSSAPCAGWLEALSAAHDCFEECGMAGALLLGADGRIAAAGAAIAPDGSLAPLGVGESVTHPAFASVGDVEALPLGAVMLRATVWRRFGGLDVEIGAPALALADLALRLRRGNLRVLCQPFARLIAADPPPAGAWAEAFGRFRLRSRRDADGNGLASLGLPPPSPPRVLLVDNLVPTPDRDAASIDMDWYLRIFQELGYQVTLLPVGDLGRSGAAVDALRQTGVRVVADGWAKAPADFLAREAAPFDLLVLFRASLAGGALPQQLRAHSPRAPLIFNTVDLHFLRLEREALLLRSAEKLEAAFRTRQVELAMIARADATILLSPAEQTLVADLLPRARTYVIPILREAAGRRAPFAPRHGVLFVGGFRHHPNTDAILAFAREVWPLVRARLATTLTIVGADAPAEVMALASAADGIIVRGHVADLDPLLDGCRITVAPLRFGAGTKGKIVTSLAAGVPCVASPVAAEGMSLTDGLTVRVAATPAAFAEAVVALHESESLWLAQSDAGMAFAAQHHSVAAVRARIVAMLRDLGVPAGTD